MNSNKFLGVAYWTVTTAVADWLQKATAILAVLEQAGLAVVTFDSLPAGNQMTVRFGSDQWSMMVNEGQGRGKVHVCPSSGCFVICLVALRKALGDLSVVTDAQAPVAARPQQSDPLYASDWLRNLKVAQELGLVRGEAFVARHATVFANMF